MIFQKLELRALLPAPKHSESFLEPGTLKMFHVEH